MARSPQQRQIENEVDVFLYRNDMNLLPGITLNHLRWGETAQRF